MSPQVCETSMGERIPDSAQQAQAGFNPQVPSQHLGTLSIVTVSVLERQVMGITSVL